MSLAPPQGTPQCGSLLFNELTVMEPGSCDLRPLKMNQKEAFLPYKLISSGIQGGNRRFMSRTDQKNCRMLEWEDYASVTHV